MPNRAKYLLYIALRAYLRIMPKASKPKPSKKSKGKALKGNQYKLDKNHNGRLDRRDFELLRKGKGKKGKKGKK